MKKKQLWKDIRRSITGSYGRFLSIFSLMLLGAFAFVGLKVTGPDMRTTAENFYSENNLAFVTVTSTWGLNKEDQQALEKTEKLDEIEYGYLKDVVVKDTDTSFRIFSAPDDLSKYEVMEGKMPSGEDEIALDYLQQENYNLGDEIQFSEEEDAEGKTALKKQIFTISGFIKSSEIIDKTSIGQTTVGKGQLDSYAVVEPNVFDSEVYMIARLSFTDTKKMDAYSDEYHSVVGKHKENIDQLLAERSSERLTEVKKEKQEELDEANDEIIEAKDDLASVESKLTQAREQIDAAKAQLEESRALGSGIPELQQQYEAANQEIAAQEAAYNEQLAAFNEKKAEAESEIKDGERELAEGQADLDELEAPVYTISDRKDNPGYKQYLENSQRIDVLSNVFPVFLFAIAALVSLTTMTRFVDEQRINMGTLKALGYSNKDIKKKFVVYGLVSSSLGALAGTLLGHTLLPTVIFNAYAATSTFSEVVLLFSPKYTIIAILTAVICTVVPAYILASGELKERTASLLLPKPPKVGARILLEKIKPIWNRMSFTYKVTARNLFRYKKRMFMTIIGVAGCTALLITGFGIRDSLSGIVDEQFGQLINYDLITVYEDGENIDPKLKEQNLDEDIAESTDIRYEEVSVIAGENDDKQSITLLSPEKMDGFSDFITVRNRKDRSEMKLSDTDVILSEKLAQLLDVETGDQITVQDDKEMDRRMTITGITEMYMGHYIFMGKEAYASTFDKELVRNGKLMILENDSAENSDTIAADLMTIEGIKGVVQSKELSKKIDAVMGGLNNVIIALIVCAMLLAVVVIYNLTNINVSERIRELSTIKVLGFYDNEVTLYIYRETIILSVFGILFGYVMGFFLHRFIMVSLPPDEAMFKPELMPMNFLLSAIITMTITFMIMGVMHYKIRSVNMLDALKSVD